jgi:hypothetical protein
MVPCSSPVSSAPTPTPTKHVPAVVTASREAEQDNHFKGSLLESCGTVAHLTSDARLTSEVHLTSDRHPTSDVNLTSDTRPTSDANLTSDASGSLGPGGKNTCKVQRSVKDVDAAQTETQPPDGKAAPVQAPHGHGKTRTVTAKNEHVAQTTLRSAKKQEMEESLADKKTAPKEAPVAQGSACSIVNECSAPLQGTLIPATSPTRRVDSEPAIGQDAAVQTKTVAAAGKLTTTARGQGETTSLPGKLHDASPAMQQAEAGKDSGEQRHLDPLTGHSSQEIVVNALPAASHASKPFALQSTTPSTLPTASNPTASSPTASNPMEQPGDSRTLAATATSLEVGISSGTHGWLRVRAELDPSGTVAAAVVTSSATAAENLTRHLPAMSEYLAQETTRIGSIVVHASSASGTATSFLSNPVEWSGISNSAAGEREQRNSDRDQQLYPESEAGLGPEVRPDGIRSGMEPVQPVWPGLLRGQRGTGTHWVSVRV